MSDKFFVGYDLTGFADNGAQKPISRVTLMVDDENAITAGDDSGMELSADCPHATQAMVNYILASVKGKPYRMFTAENAKLDPAAELGDGVTAGRVYSTISRISDDGNVFPGITAPGQAELEDEYPDGGPMTQAFKRKISETRSQITKTADEIRLSVKKVENDVEKYGSEFSIRLDGISTRVSDAEGNISAMEQTVNGIKTTVSNIDGDFSKIEQKINSISLDVSGSLGSKASIRLTVGDKKIDGDLDLSDVRRSFAEDDSEIAISAGRVTFNSGTFVLNGNNVSIDKDGTLSSGISLKTVVKNGSLLYYLTDQYLGRSGGSRINSPYMRGIATSLSGGCDYIAWSVSEDTLYDNQSSIKMIYTKSLTSFSNTVYPKQFSADTISFACNTAFYRGTIFYVEASGMQAAGGNIRGTAEGPGLIISGESDLYLKSNYSIDLSTRYISVNGEIVSSSDARLKRNIKESDIDALGVINRIKTYSFDWIKSGEHKNMGFIAQQLQEDASCDLVHYDEANDIYRVKEMSFIPYIVKAVQQLYNIINGQSNQKESVNEHE